jgi:hypothetical protein
MELKPESKSSRHERLPVRINRKAPIALFPFTDYFKGFEKVTAVRTLLGARADRFLSQIKVEFIHGSFLQMAPSEEGHILVSIPYLKSSDRTSIYLDVLVCLNLMKRASEVLKSPGPTQREFWNSAALLKSYKSMLEEARRLRVPRAEVLEHLNLPQFMMSAAGYRGFLRKLGLIKTDKPSRR